MFLPTSCRGVLDVPPCSRSAFWMDRVESDMLWCLHAILGENTCSVTLNMGHSCFFTKAAMILGRRMRFSWRWSGGDCARCSSRRISTDILLFLCLVNSASCLARCDADPADFSWFVSVVEPGEKATCLCWSETLLREQICRMRRRQKRQMVGGCFFIRVSLACSPPEPFAPFSFPFFFSFPSVFLRGGELCVCPKHLFAWS